MKTSPLAKIVLISTIFIISGGLMISDKDGISIEWLSKMIGMDGQSRWSYSGEIVPVALLACQVG